MLLLEREAQSDHCRGLTTTGLNVNQLLIIAVLSLSVPAPAHSPSPMAQLIQWNNAVGGALRGSYPFWSPEAEMQRSNVKRLIGGSMDYAEMSKRALGDYWGRLSNEERAEFVTDLGRLIESRYLARGIFLGPDSQIRFEREAVTTRGTASVYATVSREQRRKALRLRVEYRLQLKADRWLVYDLVTDGTSLLDNYRDQFSKVIARESFGALLRKLSQQADEEEKQK